MRPLPCSSRLLVVLTLASLPLACGADHGSLGDLVTDSGSGGGSGTSDGNGGSSATESQDTGTPLPPCESIPLADVAQGVGGFAMDGEADSNMSGRAVSGAGDVNGDGLADVLVGAPHRDRAYVVFGKASTDRVQLADVATGVGGFAMDGEADLELGSAGYSVSGAGDVNGDGLDDLIVGSWEVDITGYSAYGRAYVVFGRTDTAAVALADVAGGTGGFALDGEDIGAPGCSVSTVGDMNGDGLSDVVVGAERSDASATNSGRAYVVFGKTDTDPVSLADVAGGIGGFALDGEAAGDEAGQSVSGAGDVNGDGVPDVVVGAQFADPNGLDRSGRTYVVFGKANTDRVSLADVAQGIGGFVLDGETEEERSGCSVSGAGDVDGDGLADVIVGAAWADPNGIDRAGRAYVVFGKADTARVNLADVRGGVGGFAVDGDADEGYSGRSVSGAGDANGDGLADMIVGARGADPNGVNDSGQTYVVFGKTSTEPLSPADLAQGIGGFVLDGAATGDESGFVVSGAGDVDGDGIPDIIVSAPEADPSGPRSGRSYVVFGPACTGGGG